MKTLNKILAVSCKAKPATVALILSLAGFGFSGDDKITICHMPPGNPDNCHQITISTNALQPHLDHGDRLFCYEEARYTEYLKMVDYNGERIIKMYERP